VDTANADVARVDRARIAEVALRVIIANLRWDVTRWCHARSSSADKVVHSLGDSVRIIGFVSHHLAAIFPGAGAYSMPSERCSDVVDATGASVTVGHDGSGIVRRQKATIARAAGVDLAASIVLVGVVCIEIVTKFWVGGVY
jgi:hypothetical protein